MEGIIPLKKEKRVFFGAHVVSHCPAALFSLVAEEEAALGRDSGKIFLSEGSDAVEDRNESLCYFELHGFALGYLTQQLSHTRFDGRELKHHRRVEPSVGMAGEGQDPEVLAPQDAGPPLERLQCAGSSAVIVAVDASQQTVVMLV